MKLIWMLGLEYKTVQKNIGWAINCECSITDTTKYFSAQFCTPILASAQCCTSVLALLYADFTPFLYFLHCTLLPFPSTSVKLIHCTFSTFQSSRYLREYWMIYRGQAFFGLMIRLLTNPPPPSSISKLSSFSVCLRVAGLAYWPDGGGGAIRQIIWPHEKVWPSINH